ncbi:MAG: NAD(P)-dependent oxidoreductase [Fibrobacter sp.]|nr:NAD(P)-dependent oxidoreductase [Fibrobacter sp.]
MQTLEELDQAAKQELDRIAALPTLSMKDKVAIPPQKAADLPPDSRKRTMDETSLGLTKNQAILEAHRCVKCKKPFCTAACPIGMPVPQYLECVAAGDIQGAIDIIRATSLLPSICSRVCPHERQCQSNCTMGKSHKDMSKGLQLGQMERFCTDYEREHLGGKKALPIAAPTGKKIAVIGSGPAGIAAAIDLRTKGHEVVIFESKEKLGGVLRYGIPEFRLPKHILDYELSILPQMGIECKTNVDVFKDISIGDLWAQGFNAVFIAYGASTPIKAKVPGEDLKGVFTAEEYLRKANCGEAIDSGKNVVVVGGGNVAMDASRMAYRLGAEKVRIVYRRTQSEMPSCKAEISEALEEGAEIVELRSPTEFVADENGRVAKANLSVFELGEPDENGRRKPIVVDGASDTIDCDTVVIAIGSRVDSSAKESIQGLETNPNGTILVREGTNQTSVQNVFVGGDAQLGPMTVVMAMRTGREAAAGIHEQLIA